MREINLSKLRSLIPFEWRVQSCSKTYPSATCVAYIDARAVMDLLDEVAGPENWQSDYKEIKGNLYCGIGIKIDGEWVYKWDCGSETKVEKEKGEASDAFKRSAVKWGIGRFLYDLPIQYVKTNDKNTGSNYPYPVDEKGAKIKDLTQYLNESSKVANQIMQLEKPKTSIPDEKEQAVQQATPIQKKLPSRDTLEKVFRGCKDLDRVEKTLEYYSGKYPEVNELLWFKAVYLECLQKFDPEVAKKHEWAIQSYSEVK